MGAGGGKSHTCLTKALKYINDRSARVLIVRKSYPMLRLSGGLWDESKDIYSHFGGIPKEQKMTWVFPNGATIQFVAMPENLGSFQGLQASHVLIDESAEFELNEVLFLMSRLRSAKYVGHLSMMMTCNPDSTSFLRSWVDWCLDKDTGVPMPGTENHTRWFINVSGKLIWGSSKEELIEAHGKEFQPLSFRFIPLTVYDNPVLLKNNPGYLANLLSQPRVNQLRFLHGSWSAREAGASYFDRSWCQIVDHPPVNPIARVRSWDLAASVPSESCKIVDWSAGTLLSRDKFGTYYIEDAKRFQKLTDGVLKEIVTTAHNDGLDTLVTIPRDAGAGGKTANSFYIRTLAENGIAAKSVVMSGHSGKVQRFLPFAALAESGSVRIVRGDWNEDFLSELEIFDGGRKNHDDFCDSVSDAFNSLSRQVTLPTFALPNMGMPSTIPRI